MTAARLAEIRQSVADYDGSTMLWRQEQLRDLLAEVDRLNADREHLDWCAENEIQFSVERGSCGHPDRWIVYQEQRWDLPLGEGATALAAIRAAREKEAK